MALKTKEPREAAEKLLRAAVQLAQRIEDPKAENALWSIAGRCAAFALDGVNTPEEFIELGGLEVAYKILAGIWAE